MQKVNESIRKKILDKDLNFTLLEQKYLEDLHEPESDLLRNMFFNTLKENDYLWNENIKFWLKDFFELIYYHAKVTKISDEISEAVYNHVLVMLSRPDASYEEIISISYMVMNDSLSKELKIKIFKKFNNLEDISSKNFNDIIVELLNQRRYKEIGSLKYIEFDKWNLSASTITRLEKEYPFLMFGYPPAFVKLGFDDKFVYMDIDTLKRAYDDFREPVGKECRRRLKNWGTIQKKSSQDIIALYDMAKFDNIAEKAAISIILAKMNCCYTGFEFYLDSLCLILLNNISNPKKDANTDDLRSWVLNHTIPYIIDNIKTNKYAYDTMRYNLINNNATVAEEKIFDVFLENNDLDLVFLIKDEKAQAMYEAKLIKRLESSNQLLMSALKLKKEDDYHGNWKIICPNLFKYALKNGLISELNGKIFKLAYHIDFETDETMQLYLNALKNKNISIDFSLANISLNTVQKLKVMSVILDREDVTQLSTSTLSKIFNLYLESDKDNAKEMIAIRQKIVDLIKKSDEFAIKLVSEYKEFEGFNENTLEVFRALLGKNRFTAKKCLSELKHISYDYHLVLYDAKTYNAARENIAFIEHIDVKKMDYVVGKKGYELIYFINDKTIKKLLNLPYEEIDKILALFPDTKFELSDAERYYKAIKMEEFNNGNKHIVNMFGDLVDKIDHNENYQIYFEPLIEAMNSAFFEKFPDFYQLGGSNNSRELLDFIIGKIKSNSDERAKYLNILHTITDYYIEAKQRKYCDENFDLQKDLRGLFSINHSEEVKCFTNYLLANADTLVKDNVTLRDEIWEQIKDEVEFSRQEYDATVNDFNNHGLKYSNNIEIITKCMNMKIDGLAIYFSLFDAYSSEDIYDFRRKKIAEGKISLYYEPDEPSRRIYECLSGINIDLIREKLLTNDIAYEKLKKIMYQEKLHILPDALLYRMCTKTDPNWNIRNVSDFINYFYRIINMMSADSIKDDKPIDIMEVMKFLKVCSGEYELEPHVMLLGKDVTKLIEHDCWYCEEEEDVRKNGNHYAILDEILEVRANNFQRREIVVPPINTIIKIGNKEMNCVVGNFTEMNILNSTDLCMSETGAQNNEKSLYLFSSENKNGFYVFMKNPDTGAVVFKANCFRNGNTVSFCEAIREKDASYTDLDIYNFIKKISELIISESKKSTMPIDNVITFYESYITDFSDIDESEINSANLNIKNIFEDLPSLYCYEGVEGNEVVLLASSSADNTLVPVNLDKEQIPSYQVCRNKLTYSSNIMKMYANIQRVHAMNEYLKTKKLVLIEPITFETGFIYGVGNDDWYIYIDNNYDVHSEIISLDERATKEYENAMEYINQYVCSKKKKGDGKLGI